MIFFSLSLFKWYWKMVFTLRNILFENKYLSAIASQSLPESGILILCPGGGGKELVVMVGGGGMVYFFLQKKFFYLKEKLIRFCFAGKTNSFAQNQTGQQISKQTFGLILLGQSFLFQPTRKKICRNFFFVGSKQGDSDSFINKPGAIFSFQ